MTRRELNLAIFERTTDKVLWQPRLETWIAHHQEKGTMPARYKDLDYFGIYDALHCSVRYAASRGIEPYYDTEDIRITQTQEGDHWTTTIETPRGTLTTVERNVYWEEREVNRRIEKYPVSTPEGLEVVNYLTEHTQYRVNQEAFRTAAERMGHRGEPTHFLNSSGFTQLIKDWCGLAGTFYLFADHPDAVDAYMEGCEQRDDRQVEAALQLPCRIFNLGDHATNEFTPPPILKKYLLPRWQRISAVMHANNRFIHSHWDGHSKLMLPYLKETGLDSIESLTPEPMGDMTLEEIKTAVGDEIICLDLIPAIHFLKSYSTQAVVDFAARVIDMFAPRLILGISDEISQVGQIEKVEAITELVERVCGLAE